jgi:hypothetical protein
MNVPAARGQMIDDRVRITVTQDRFPIDFAFTAVLVFSDAPARARIVSADFD